ncbi:MAG: Zn-dependent oligopeptidase [Cellvibrionaceae bacterium]|nr:Zn-dependent oligopeptidase [Cellvibrionaceae bacterium]
MFRVVVFVSTLLMLMTYSGDADSDFSGQLKNPIFPIEYQSFGLESLSSALAIDNACDEFIGKLQAKKLSLENSKVVPHLNSFYAPLDSMMVSLNNFSGGLRLISDSFDDPNARESSRSCNEKVSDFKSGLNLSKDIYSKYLQVNKEGLDQETQYSLSKRVDSLQRGGVGASDDVRNRLNALVGELVEVEQEFNKNINEGVRYVKVKPEELGGVPEEYLNSRKPDENGYIEISTRYPDLVPVISYADNDEVKRKLWFEFWRRAYPENVSVVKKLLQKRYEYAKLLGYKNYAHYVIADKMVGSPQRVQRFLQQINEYTKSAEKKDYNRLLKRLRDINPSAAKVELWQRDYLYELVLKEQLNVDSQKIREYFSFSKTKNGVLSLIQDLFDVQIKDWDTWVWNELVTAHEVYDDGKLIGKFYLDLHPRKGKFNHAKVITLQQGIGSQQTAVAAMLANFPSGNESLSHNDVVTFLHEFGHVMHVVFSHGKWSNTAGVTTERDFIEAPSQMLEEWLWHYPTLSRFATNKKGEVLPKVLFDSMKAARNFNLGMNTRQQLHYAAFSLEVYNQNPEGLDVDRLSDALQSEYTLFPANENQYLYTSFTHLNGYSAAYYSYLWSLAISTDILSEFKDSGMMNKETARRYRRDILSKGGSKPADALLEDFLGRQFSFDAYAGKLKSYSKE